MPNYVKWRQIHLGTNYSVFGNPSPVYYDERRSVEFYLGDTGRYGYPNFPGNKDVGGPLHIVTFKEEVFPSASVTLRRYANSDEEGRKYGFKGQLASNTPGGVLTYTNPALNAAGRQAEAYSKMKPAQPEMALLNTIFELKEFPLMLKSRFDNGLKDISSFWVALQFGWLPLLRDVRSFVQIQRNAQKMVKQLMRDNGRPVRRTIELANAATSIPTATGASYSAFSEVFITQMYYSEPKWVVTGKTWERYWASGRFRYYLPPGPRDVEWNKKMVRRLYGLYPSPKFVYDAIPWTWLIDWFSGLGDVISNMDAGVADRLAADYFYTMHENGITKEQTVTGSFRGPDTAPLSVSAITRATKSRKTRHHGNPFGLPSGTTSLSPMQLSILGALGLSKLL